MKALVVGASGATGRLLVEQLLNAGHHVKVIVRRSSNIPPAWSNGEHLTVERLDVSEIKVDKMAALLADCQAIASCLGHNLSLKGMYGRPRDLVARTVQLLCESVLKNAPGNPVRFVLMNTAGNSNKDINERVSTGQKIVIGLLRVLLPPHPDNEKAAEYLRTKIGQENRCVEWAVVRPDTLTDENTVSAYSLHVSPTRNAIFNPGKTSRINVAHFMAKLITVDGLWQNWKGQMPVIYNAAETVT